MPNSRDTSCTVVLNCPKFLAASSPVVPVRDTTSASALFRSSAPDTPSFKKLPIAIAPNAAAAVAIIGPSALLNLDPKLWPILEPSLLPAGFPAWPASSGRPFFR